MGAILIAALDPHVLWCSTQPDVCGLFRIECAEISYVMMLCFVCLWLRCCTWHI
jgi:hypothetical protein